MKVKLLIALFCILGFQQTSFAGGQLAGLGALEETFYWIISTLIVYFLFLFFQWKNKSSVNRNYSFFIYILLIILATLFFIPLFFILKNGFSNSFDRSDVNWLIAFGILFITSIIAIIQTYIKDR